MDTVDMDQQVLFEYPEGFQQALDCSLDFLPEEARAEFLIAVIAMTMLM